MSRFSMTPQVRMNRSRFDLSKDLKTSMSVGRLYPLDILEVLPGDTFKNKTTCVARVTSSFLKPVLDNCYLDLYHFFVPYRLVYKDAERVFGNPNPSAYVDNQLSEFPSFRTRQNVKSGTVADYLGLPIGNVPGDISVLPFRAFALIYNQWFRNENTVAETYVQTGEFSNSENLNNNAWSPNNYTGKLPFVGKRKDYFTSALPSPQKGAPISVNLSGNLPVSLVSSAQPLNLMPTGNGGITKQISLVSPASGTSLGGSLQILGNYLGNTALDGASPLTLAPNQLQVKADDVTFADVNNLRFAFQLQKMLERDALYGSRYNEFLLGHFGVSSPDARLQLAEYLGGARIPISVQQVAQTSQGTEESPLGAVGAFSVSSGKSRFTKSFVEHGYIITCGCIRTMHTYQQGINKMWSRLARNDFYDPLFATLGEQPIYKSELYASSQSTMKGSIFGYNEAWADYRYSPSRVSGQMRTASEGNLDQWHFADYYTTAPVLGEQFTNETSTFFDRTLSVPSTSIDNFICDFWFDTKATRVMPLYSIPGLVDHH